MAQEPTEISRFQRVNQGYTDSNMNLFVKTSLLGAYMPILAGACTLIIIGYGSHLVGTGDITLGTYAAFFSYLAMLLWPVREAGNLVTQWQRAASGAQRLFEVLDYQPEIRDQPSHWSPDVSGHIILRDLGLPLRREKQECSTEHQPRN